MKKSLSKLRAQKTEVQFSIKNFALFVWIASGVYLNFNGKLHINWPSHYVKVKEQQKGMAAFSINCGYLMF